VRSVSLTAVSIMPDSCPFWGVGGNVVYLYVVRLLNLLGVNTKIHIKKKFMTHIS
jgi:hypothetical protein